MEMIIRLYTFPKTKSPLFRVGWIKNRFAGLGQRHSPLEGKVPEAIAKGIGDHYANRLSQVPLECKLCREFCLEAQELVRARILAVAPPDRTPAPSPRNAMM
jgi:hypothetical protein